MASACALAIVSGKIILNRAMPERLRTLRHCIFTGRGQPPPRRNPIDVAPKQCYTGLKVTVGSRWTCYREVTDVVPLPLFLQRAKEVFYDASCFFPPSVFEGRRRGSPFHRCCRAAEQLRRLRCGRHCRNRRQRHLHRAVRPPARHPELSHLLCRPGPVPRHPLRGHAGGVRQPRQDP